MLKLGRFITLILAGTISALMFTSLAACSSGPNPNAKKVLVGCYAVTSGQIGKIFGVSHPDAMMLSGENSPIQVCKYTDTDTGDTLAIAANKKFDSANAASELAADAAQQKALFKKNINPSRSMMPTALGLARSTWTTPYRPRFLQCSYISSTTVTR